MENLTLSELKESYPRVAAEFEKEILEAAKSGADAKEKEARIKALEEAAEKDKAKYAELETKLNEAKSVELVEAAFPNDLPDIAKDKLRETLKGETDEAKIKEAVEKEATYIATLADAGKVKGMGGGAPDKREAFVESATKDVLNMAGYKEPEDDNK